MSLAGARVLLTGGTGFIGSRLAAALSTAGAKTTLLVRESSRGDRLGDLWTKLPKVIADIEDPASLARAVGAADPDYAFHLARPEGADFTRQARATAALAAALAGGAPRLKRWVRTAHAAGALGRGGDAELARALGARHRLSIVTLELFLVYGPGQSPGDSPRDLAEAALSGRPLRAPAEAKDLIFVDDAVRAYLLAALAPRVSGASIPIGGGRLVPGLETARAAARAAGRRAEEVAAPAASFDGGHPAEPGPARDLLGWAPSTSVEEGMRQLIQWCRDEG